MTDDEPLRALLRSALPRDRTASQRDLWPALAQRLEARPRWSPFDVGLAAVVALVLLFFPEAIWLMAFHL